MKKSLAVPLGLTGLIVSSGQALAETAPPAPVALLSPNWSIGWAIMTAFLVLVGFNCVKCALSGGNWSLSRALKEPYTPPAPSPAPQNYTPPAMELVESSSRLIAVMGFVMMLVVYLSFACLYLLSIAQGHGNPEWIDKAGTFMVSGLTLFAPYAVNKISTVGK